MNSREGNVVLPQKNTYFPLEYTKKRLIGKVQQLNWVRTTTTGSSKKKKTIITLVPKGLKTILAERDYLSVRKLPISKYTSPKCNSLVYPPKASNEPPCCLARILANHEDFFHQKSAIEKLLLARGHKCIFLPKFYYKLNPIKIY
jgi:hypothetical protein